MKRKENILDLFDGLDDSFVLEAIESRRTEKPILYKNRIMLIAAAIAMTLLLVGCGIVYILKMQDLIIGETNIPTPTWNDSTGEMNVQPITHQILTVSGVKGSANYKAAQEWMEFEAQYDPDGTVLQEARLHPTAFSGEYDAYDIYSQEQADKLLEIAQNNDLQLAGPEVIARSPKSLLAYLNIDNLLVPDAQAVLSNMVTEYYEQGMFYADFYLLMNSGEDFWPWDTLCLYYYTPKSCFNDKFAFLPEISRWREWNYTTLSGQPVLIMRSDDKGEVYVFCDLVDATVAVKIYTEGPDGAMTDDQLQQIVNQINFSIKPLPGDAGLLQGFGTEIDPKESKQTQNGYTLEVKSAVTDGKYAYVTLTITAPDGISLKGKTIHPGNRGEGLFLPAGMQQKPPNMSVNWTGKENASSSDNTMDLIIIAEVHSSEGLTFQENQQWSLYIEGLDISMPDSMFQKDMWKQIDGVWMFDISLN